MYTDFHSHLLPNADHGSKNIEETMVQINSAVAAGVDTIFVTPHFYMNEDKISRFLQRRERTYNELMAALDEHKIDMKIIKSAEVNLQLGLDELPELESLCIEGTKYMLLEMPMELWTNWVYNAINGIFDRGITPIIAHIDRYKNNKLDHLFGFDVLTQINAVSVTNIFTRGKMLNYIKQNRVNFLGSDSHNDDHEYKIFAKAAKIIGNEQMQVFNNNASFILK